MRKVQEMKYNMVKKDHMKKVTLRNLGWRGLQKNGGRKKLKEKYMLFN